MLPPARRQRRASGPTTLRQRFEQSLGRIEHLGAMGGEFGVNRSARNRREERRFDAFECTIRN